MTFPILADTAWLRWLLGVPPEAARHFQQGRLTFATIWPLGAAVGLLLVCLLWFGFCYWRDGRRPSWWIKGPLVALRLLAIATLMTMLAQPILRLRQVETVRPQVALLADVSESMARPDPKLPATYAAREATGTGLSPTAVPQQTRLERLNALLNHSNLLTELSKRYNVRLYTFATAPVPQPLPNDPKQRAAYRFAFAPPQEAGDTTQIGSALRRIVEDLNGQPVAGALLLSDGGNNLGEDPLPPATDAKQNGPFAVSTLGIGDPTKTKDLSLLSVLADDVVRANNTVTAYAALSQRGYAGKSVIVTLQRGGTVVGRETVRLGPDETRQEVRFNYTPTQPGRFAYTVTVTPQPGEITTANNKRSFIQTVIKKKLRLLYVEGEPRYEYRYLRNAILRDTSLEFACLLLSGDNANVGGEGTLRVRGFPADEKELFEYDLVILGDVPRSYFSDKQLEALRRFVEDRGASLLVVAGEQHTPHEYAGTPLEAILPVVLNAAPTPILTDDEYLWQLTAEGRRSPVMLLDEESAESERIWATLPGMHWAAGVARAKPGATVLAVHATRRNADGPYPIVAQQSFGAGKCLIQLADSTWRWRWRVGDRYFYRYWGQVLRSLTPRDLPGNSRFVQLNADRSAYRLGEKTLLSARLLNPFYRPIQVPNVTAIVRSETGQVQSVVLQATPGSPGLYTAPFQPERVGRYEVTLTSPVNPEAKASTGFVVESLALERQKPELDEPLLKKIAAAGGGRYYTPDRLKEWLTSLPYNPPTIRQELEYPLWNAPLLLIVFLSALSLEWLVRKRKGLL